MSKDRIKLTGPVIANRAQAEATLGDIALLTITRNEIKLALDREVVAAREKYEQTLNQLEANIVLHTGLLEQWASGNREEFGKLKSIEMQHGRIGYRTGMPKLKTLLRKTWAAVLTTLQAMKRTDLVRTTEEVNKEAIITGAQQGTIGPEELRAMGVKVEQDEAFFVEPALAKLENRTVAGV